MRTHTQVPTATLLVFRMALARKAKAKDRIFGQAICEPGKKKSKQVKHRDQKKGEDRANPISQSVLM